MHHKDRNIARTGFRCAPPALLPRGKINALRIITHCAIVAAVLAAIRPCLFGS